jgi:hypothetical protein
MRIEILLPLAFLFLTSCAPKVYIVDRQTILEEDAAGEWPQFEKELLKKATSARPVPFSQVPLNSNRARLYNVLNGELVGENDQRGSQTPGAKK